MSAANDDVIRARLAAMTVEELQRAVTTDRDDYVPRAIELTEEELARRASSDPYRDDASPLAPPHRITPQTRWWHVWVGVVAAGSVLNVIVYLVHGGFSAGLVIRICWALLVVPFALRLRRKERGEADESAKEPTDDSPSA